MFKQVMKSALAAAVLATGLAAAHAEGFHAGGDTGTLDHLTSIHGISGIGHAELAPTWSAPGSVGLAEGRFDASAGQDARAARKPGNGVEYDLTERVELRSGYHDCAFCDRFDARPSAGELVVGIQVGF